MAVELTDEEAAAARRAIQLIQAMNNNPQARTHLERSLKEVYPTVQTSEDIAANLAKPYADRIEGLEKRIADKEAAEAKAAQDRATSEALARMESSFGRLREHKGLTAEGEEKVKQIMRDRTIPDPEAAFALFESQNPRPSQEQAGWVPDQWNYDRDAVADTKGLFENPERWADDMVGQVLLEERRRNNGDS